MKITALGNSGLNVSEVCLGAMMFGTTVERSQAYRLLDAFIDQGGNFIDTSNNYAFGRVRAMKARPPWGSGCGRAGVARMS